MTFLSFWESGLKMTDSQMIGIRFAQEHWSFWSCSYIYFLKVKSIYMYIGTLGSFVPKTRILAFFSWRTFMIVLLYNFFKLKVHTLREFKRLFFFFYHFNKLFQILHCFLMFHNKNDTQGHNSRNGNSSDSYRLSLLNKKKMARKLFKE